MSSARNPKDLKQMVAESHQEIEGMQINLEKLRGLSSDDKTENALLRSRIDEQSQLIMILKQRADEALNSAKTLQRVNAELENFRDDAQEQLERELKRFNMLDARFNDLAHNHEELIKYKDEYKRVNQELRLENSRLKDENSRMFSKVIEEKDGAIRELDKKITCLRDQCCQLDVRNKDLEQTLQSKEDMYKVEKNALQKKLQDTEEKLKGVSAKLQQQLEGQQTASSEAQQRIQQLTKEKDELLSLAMSRGKLIQEKQAENKAVQEKVEKLQRTVQNMQERFEREAAAVSANLQVCKLKTDLEEADDRYDEVIKEFEAFKKHSNNLLKQEKELNARLRHLVG